MRWQRNRNSSAGVRYPTEFRIAQQGSAGPDNSLQTTCHSQRIANRMKTLIRLLVVVAVLAPTFSLARPPAEDARIEFVLGTIKTLKDAHFIRNGSEYNGTEAEAHLRMKLGRAGERVQTAEQFIEGVATKSFFSGKPYQIRFADGRTVDAGPFLLEKLKGFKPAATH